ncbi:MAG: hypothetical protein ACK55Z_23830 [bacterium]
MSRGASEDDSNADAALATAPAPADKAAPPAAARLPTLAVAAAPIAAPALKNFLFKFIKKYSTKVKPCWSQQKKKEESYSREGRSRLAEEHEEPPGDGGRDGEAGQATQRRQGDLDRAGQPAGRRLRKPDAGRVLNLKEKQIFFQTKFSHPPPINFLPKSGGRVYPVTSNLYQQFSVT